MSISERLGLYREALRRLDDVSKSGPHTGTMVALIPGGDAPDRLVVPGSSESREDIHLTLAYLKSVGDPKRLRDAVAAWAALQCPLGGVVGGVGLFNASKTSDGLPVTYASVDSPGLNEARADLVRCIGAAGFNVATDHGFTPHITLDYGDRIRSVDVSDIPLTFESVSVVGPEGRVDYPLGGLAKMDTPADGHLDGLLGDEEEDDLQAKVRKWGQVPILKAAPERRFVLAPIYIPGRVDAHGEWASADDLQQALWKMVQGGDRSVNLQHIGGTHIGEWVEIMCWPYPHTATLTNPADGTVRKVDLPANTPWMGVLFTPPAFEAVKKGLLRSFSMEGKSRRVVADIPLSP